MDFVATEGRSRLACVKARSLSDIEGVPDGPRANNPKPNARSVTYSVLQRQHPPAGRIENIKNVEDSIAALAISRGAAGNLKLFGGKLKLAARVEGRLHHAWHSSVMRPAELCTSDNLPEMNGLPTNMMDLFGRAAKFEILISGPFDFLSRAEERAIIQPHLMAAFGAAT
jgi:hypothetical protein